MILNYIFLECKEYQVALIGDFNAMCGNRLDFVIFDDPIMEVLGLEEVDRNFAHTPWHFFLICFVAKCPGHCRFVLD